MTKGRNFIIGLWLWQCIYTVHICSHTQQNGSRYIGYERKWEVCIALRNKGTAELIYMVCFNWLKVDHSRPHDSSSTIGTDNTWAYCFRASLPLRFPKTRRSNRWVHLFVLPCRGGSDLVQKRLDHGIDLFLLVRRTCGTSQYGMLIFFTILCYFCSTTMCSMNHLLIN